MSEILHWIRTTKFHHFFSTRTRQQIHFDFYFITLIVCLIVVGLIILYSALGRELPTLLTQLARLGIGFILMLVAASIRREVYFRLAPIVYSGTIALLLGVLVFGDVVKGSQRWLDFPGLPRFQPSELIKISLPLVLGWYFSIRKFKRGLLDICSIAIIVGIPTMLIFMQPDYGTAAVMLASVVGVFFVIGVSWWWFAVGGVGLVIATPLIWNFVLYDYHRERILTLFNPERDPLGAGWNIIQSKIAVGSGGLTGKGLFNGTQSHLEFIPEGHTDFVLAVYAEELGFVACMGLLCVYLLIFVRAMYLSSQSDNGFGLVVGSAIAIIFVCYVFVNVAMVLGLLPIVGLPLPLMSYGGSSAVTTMVAFGVLMSVCTRKKNMELI